MIAPRSPCAPTMRPFLLDFANQVPPAGGAELKPDEQPSLRVGWHLRRGCQARLMRVTATALILTASLFASSEALAARAPTQVEEGAIWASVVKTLRSEPRTCVGVSVAISTVNPSYAIGVPLWSNLRGCQKYAGNGYAILRLTSGRWRIVFNGSDPPNCGEIPARVVRELTGLRCL